jgi:hypothetical protein
MVSATSSSPDTMTTLPFGAVPSRHGHSPPTVTRAAMSIVSVDFEMPGWPPMIVSLPSAMRPGHSQATSPGGTSPTLKDRQKSEFDGFVDCIIIESLHNPIADA